MFSLGTMQGCIDFAVYIPQSSLYGWHLTVNLKREHGNASQGYNNKPRNKPSFNVGVAINKNNTVIHE